jgi:PAS domain S-box-containing protein
MADRTELIRRQEALGQFGEFVLDNDDLDTILNEGCRLIADALGADLAKVIQIEPANDTGLVRAGVGWKPGIVGKERVRLSERTSEAYAIKTSQPVITQNIDDEERFDFPDFLKDHGVIAIVNVPIFLPGRKPWGILQVDAQQRREFGDEDIGFLRTYAMALGPVVDRLQTVEQLTETEQRLQLVVENARSYIMVLSDADDLITDWLAGSQGILGWTRAEIIGQPSANLFTPEDRAAGMPQRELARARADGASPNVRWHIRKDGTRVFLYGQTIALRTADGSLTGYLKIAQDVTERRRHEERQELLLAELQHRVRNVLAMVRSLVQRTLAGGTSVDEIGALLQGRIDALARTQTLLTRALGVGVNLEGLVRDELEAQAANADEFEIMGPPVELAPKAAEVVTLAVHELATNAAKYGAFRHEGGRVSINWRIDQAEQPPWLRFCWQEDNIKLGPTRSAGLGSARNCSGAGCLTN